jgi:hypothetical protein
MQSLRQYILLLREGEQHQRNDVQHQKVLAAILFSENDSWRQKRGLEL